MNRASRIVSWPAAPGNALVPWYVVLRRLAFCPIFYAGFGLAFVGLALGWGRDEAARFWRDVL